MFVYKTKWVKTVTKKFLFCKHSILKKKWNFLFNILIFDKKWNGIISTKKFLFCRTDKVGVFKTKFYKQTRNKKVSFLLRLHQKKWNFFLMPFHFLSNIWYIKCYKFLFCKHLTKNYIVSKKMKFYNGVCL